MFLPNQLIDTGNLRETPRETDTRDRQRDRPKIRGIDRDRPTPPRERHPRESVAGTRSILDGRARGAAERITHGRGPDGGRSR